MTERIEGIYQARFLLIIGVVLAHIAYPDWLPAQEQQMNIGVWGIFNFVHLILNRSVVPLFFIVSGMLYFRGVRRLTVSLYLRKLRSRGVTLLMPYLLWNTICLLTLWARWRWGGDGGYGVFLPAGGVDWGQLALMYWASPAMDGLPCAYAFWFIRNLMVFVILSPIVWIIGRSVLATTVTVLICALMGSTYWSFLWFVVGGCMGMQGWRIPRLRRGWLYLLWIPVMLYAGYVGRAAQGSQWVVVMLIVTLMGGVVIRYLAGVMWSRREYPLTALCVSSTFMIYGFHQIVARPVTQWWMTLTGYTTWYGAIATYLCSLTTILAISISLYALLHRLTPGLLRLLTGGRT